MVMLQRAINHKNYRHFREERPLIIGLKSITRFKRYFINAFL